MRILSLCVPFFRLAFLLVTEWIVHLSSPTSAATDMDIDKAPGDEETDDAATSRAGKSARLKLILSIELSVS